MSGHHEDASERKGTTRDFLRLPAKAPADEQLITSSPRAKKKEGAHLATPPAKRLNTGKQLQSEAQVRGSGAELVSDTLQSPLREKDISQQKVEELASPELRRRSDDDQHNRHNASLDDRTDKPGDEPELLSKSEGLERPAHDLHPDTVAPGGLPMPTFQAGAREPTPEAGGDARQRGVLKSIFSPVFQLFHPGKQEGDLSKHAPKPVKLRENGTPPRARSRSPEEWAKVAEDDAQPGNPEIQKAETTTLQRPPIGDSPSPGDPALKCRPAASDGASSTDGESETCLTARSPAATSREVKQGPESDSESEMGEETCTAELAAVPANDEEDGDNDLYEFAFDPYSFIKSLPPLENCVPAWRRALLPKQTRNCKQKTLVLDLDETLVHSTLDFGEAKTDFMFEVSLNNKKHCVNVRQRPHMSHFLQRCAELFELVIFTASQKLYAEQLLNIIDPGRKLIRHRIYRDSCLFVEGNYLKDLTLLGRDLANTLIIDNSPQAFGFQLANGVPIESWYDDDSDDELLRMLPFLESLVDVPDVRPYIMNAFKLHTLVDQAPGYV